MSRATRLRPMWMPRALNARAWGALSLSNPDGSLPWQRRSFGFPRRMSTSGLTHAVSQQAQAR